jgi:hypothetical protein
MLFPIERCRACGEGILGFFRTSDGRLVMLCDECDGAYPEPNKRSLDDAFDLGPSPFKEGRWATREEVEAAGWLGAIGGENNDYRY